MKKQRFNIVADWRLQRKTMGANMRRAPPRLDWYKVTVFLD